MQNEKFIRTAGSLEYYAKQFREMSKNPSADNAAEALNIINSLSTNLHVQAYISQLLKSSQG
jgi:hypothetical protein